jgi:hypothetical protein
MFPASITLARRRRGASAPAREYYSPDFSDGGADLNGNFGNICEGKPKTIYYRPIPASSASAGSYFPPGPG